MASGSSKNLKKGNHESVLTIPGNLLNDDIYEVDLLFVHKTSKVLFKLFEVLTFEVINVPRKGNWFGKWIGAVRPNLNFSLDEHI